MHDIITITLPNSNKKEMYKVLNFKNGLLKIIHKYKIKFQGQKFNYLYLYKKGDYVHFVKNKKSWELIECHIGLLSGWASRNEKMENVHIGEHEYAKL